MNIVRTGVLVLLGLMLTACDEDGKKTSGSAEPPAPLVKVVELKRMDVPLYATFMGQTQGSRSAAVRAQVSGILQQRLFEEGAYVEKGAVLFLIDEAPYERLGQRLEGIRAHTKTLCGERRESAAARQRAYRLSGSAGSGRYRKGRRG